MKNKIFQLSCPNCSLKAEASLDGPYHKFIVYTCPKCRSNVIYYKNKVDTISDILLKKLMKKHRLIFCGDVSFSGSGINKSHIRGPITKEDIVNLKILLETERDTSSFLSKL